MVKTGSLGRPATLVSGIAGVIVVSDWPWRPKLTIPVSATASSVLVIGGASVVWSRLPKPVPESEDQMATVRKGFRFSGRQR